MHPFFFGEEQYSSALPHEIILGAGASTELSLTSLFWLILVGQGSHQALV